MRAPRAAPLIILTFAAFGVAAIAEGPDKVGAAIGGFVLGMAFSLAMLALFGGVDS